MDTKQNSLTLGKKKFAQLLQSQSADRPLPSGASQFAFVAEKSLNQRPILPWAAHIWYKGLAISAKLSNMDTSFITLSEQLKFN